MIRIMPPDVNFINVLQAAFTRPDPKSAKKTDKLTVFFTLSGSARAKAACRMLMKSAPEKGRKGTEINSESHFQKKKKNSSKT